MLNKKSLALNIFYLFAGQGVSGILFFIAMAYLARILGPENFGIINFCEVVFMFFLALSTLGINFIGTREVARDKSKISYYVGRFVSLRLILSAASLALLFIFVIIFLRESTIRHVSVVYGLALIPAAFFLDWFFQGLEKMYYVTLSALAKALFFAGGVFLLVKDVSRILWIAYLYLFSWIASSLILILIYRLKYGSLALKIDVSMQKKIFLDSWPIGIGLLVGWVLHYFDSTVVFFLKGEGAAGIYNAAYRPIILFVTALTVYFSAIFPAMSRAAASNSASMRKIVSVTMGAGYLFLFPLAALGGFFAKPLVGLVYGIKFGASAMLFAFLLWWPVILLAVLVYTRILVCYDHQKWIGKISSLTAALNIFLNLILIPLLGVLGACLAKLGADVVTLFVYKKVTTKIFSFPLLDIVICPALATFIMLVFLYAFRASSAWLMISIAFSVYILAVILLSRIFSFWKDLLKIPLF